MKKTRHSLTISIAVMILTLCVSSLAAPAQSGTVSERRIRFGRGRTTAIVKGGIKAAHSDVYKLSARAGQQMALHLASANRAVSFSLIAPNQETIADAFTVRDWSGELPQSGDYTITVVNNSGRVTASSYTLEATVR